MSTEQQTEPRGKRSELLLSRKLVRHLTLLPPQCQPSHFSWLQSPTAVQQAARVPVIPEVGNNIVHDIYKQRDNSLLFITVENHIQEVSQNLWEERKTHYHALLNCLLSTLQHLSPSCAVLNVQLGDSSDQMCCTKARAQRCPQCYKLR